MKKRWWFSSSLSVCVILFAATLAMSPGSAEAGDIRFQRLGNITRFQSERFGNGSIYNYGNHGRVQLDDDGFGSFNRYGTGGYGSGSYGTNRRFFYDESPQLQFQFEPRVQYGADVPLYAPLQRPFNRPAWAR